jgi:hypothetical protein
MCQIIKRNTLGLAESGRGRLLVSEPACNAFYTITPRYFHAWLQAGLRAYELVVTPNLPPSHDEHHHSGCWANFFSFTVAGAAQELFCKKRNAPVSQFHPSFRKEIGAPDNLQRL